MATAAVIARILTQYSDKGSKAAQKDIARLEKKIAAFGKKSLKSFAVASAAAGAFAIKIGIDAVKGAAEDEKQQALLANAIRNTTSATDEAIKSNSKFLDQLELQVAIDNNELMPALQRLVVATGDLSQAQNLLVLSTNVAALAGKDLGTVTTAISKAINGQFGALTKLGLPIDKTALKQKDLNKILSDFAEISKGAASAATNTYAGRLKVLTLSYNQVIDKLGYALMPLILEFTEYLTAPGGLLDALDEWIETNETQLQESLKGVTTFMKLIIDNGDKLTTVLNLLVTVSGFLDTSILGVIRVFETLIGLFVLGKLIKFAKGLGLVSKEFTIFGKRYDVVGKKAAAAAAAAAKTGEGFKTTEAVKSVGIIKTAVNFLIKRWRVVLGLATLAGAIVGGIKSFFGPSDTELLKKMQDQAKKDFQKEQVRAAKKKQDAILYNNELKITVARDKAAAAAEAKRAAAAKKTAEIEAKTAAIKKRIEGISGLKITDADEYELIQLTAVEKLQKKQKDADDSLKERIGLRKEELALFNSLTAKTAQYLDFLKAINSDGKLDDSELVKLMSKWNLTQTAASKYADFVYAIGDRKLSDIEIENLKNKWGLTTKQVVDYLAKIGAPVDAKGTALSAGDIAALGWKNASSALDAYNAKLKGDVITSLPPTMNPPISGGVQDLIDREMAIDKPFMPSPTPYDSQDDYATSLGRYFGGVGPAPIKPSYAGTNFRSSTFDNGMDLMSDTRSNSNSPTINLAVYGSVTTEQDLVQTIRQGLLQGQSSGYGLLLQEI
jgi:hypothetical protein